MCVGRGIVGLMCEVNDHYYDHGGPDRDVTLPLSPCPQLMSMPRQ